MLKGKQYMYTSPFITTQWEEILQEPRYREAHRLAQCSSYDIMNGSRNVMKDAM